MGRSLLCSTKFTQYENESSIDQHDKCVAIRITRHSDYSECVPWHEYKIHLHRSSGSGIYIGGGQRGRPPPHRTFLSENLELAGKLEVGYLTVFRLQDYKSQKIGHWCIIEMIQYYGK